MQMQYNNACLTSRVLCSGDCELHPLHLTVITKNDCETGENIDNIVRAHASTKTHVHTIVNLNTAPGGVAILLCSLRDLPAVLDHFFSVFVYAHAKLNSWFVATAISDRDYPNCCNCCVLN